jgi:hypothetical protein
MFVGVCALSTRPASAAKRRVAGQLRIGVVDRVAESFAAEDDHETVLPHRLDEHFHAGNLDRLQQRAHLDAALGRRPAGAAVADLARLVDRAEVAADGDVLGPDLEVDAQRFEDAAADAVLERVVAEQAEVAGAAAGGDARQDRDAHAADAFAGQRVEVRRPRRLEFRLAVRLDRQAAQAVRNE